ncbi:hypothetical protein ACVWZA_001401 [Sphingomonas sp. UYAg733]
MALLRARVLETLGRKEEALVLTPITLRARPGD